MSGEKHLPGSNEIFSWLQNTLYATSSAAAESAKKVTDPIQQASLETANNLKNLQTPINDLLGKLQHLEIKEDTKKISKVSAALLQLAALTQKAGGISFDLKTAKEFDLGEILTTLKEVKSVITDLQEGKDSATKYKDIISDAHGLMDLVVSAFDPLTNMFTGGQLQFVRGAAILASLNPTSAAMGAGLGVAMNTISGYFNNVQESSFTNTATNVMNGLSICALVGPCVIGTAAAAACAGITVAYVTDTIDLNTPGNIREIYNIVKQMRELSAGIENPFNKYSTPAENSDSVPQKKNITIQEIPTAMKEAYIEAWGNLVLLKKSLQDTQKQLSKLSEKNDDNVQKIGSLLDSLKTLGDLSSFKDNMAKEGLAEIVKVLKTVKEILENLNKSGDALKQYGDLYTDISNLQIKVLAVITPFMNVIDNNDALKEAMKAATSGGGTAALASALLRNTTIGEYLTNLLTTTAIGAVNQIIPQEQLGQVSEINQVLQDIAVLLGVAATETKKPHL